MAATRLIPLHVNKGKTVAQCLSDRVGYAENPEKTDRGKLVTPEEANQVGYETAMRFTKGKHAFTVSTHIDREHVHNHIIYNSTTLDCTRKFQDFYYSALALRKVSDLVCAEHGLSVITPKPYRERQKRTIYPYTRSKRAELCQAIDQALREKQRTYGDFLNSMKKLGYEYIDGEKSGFRKEGEKRAIRLRSLAEEYADENLRAIVVEGKRLKNPMMRAGEEKRKSFNLLIDIEAKLAEGKSKGYEIWAKKFNRKEAARTVCLLKERGINHYEELAALTDQLTARFSALSEQIKTAEKRMMEISALTTHLNNYARTRAVYVDYQKSGYSKAFFEEHREELQLHKAAKDAFNQLEGKKIPKRKELSEEYHRLLTEKRQAYSEYHQVKKEMREYLVAKQTVESILGIHREDETKSRRTAERKADR